MKLRIAVDLDGTVYPWSQAVNEYLEWMYELDPIGDHKHWDYLEQRILPYQWEQIWSYQAAEGVFGREDLIYPGAKKAVQQLCNEHEVHFVTHRHPCRTAEVTGRWLRAHFRNYAGVHLVTNRCGKDTLGEWDVVIDDKPSTLEAFFIRDLSLVLAPVRPWNRDFLDEWSEINVYAFHSFTDWADVPALITNHYTKEFSA